MFVSGLAEIQNGLNDADKSATICLTRRSAMSSRRLGFPQSLPPSPALESQSKPCAVAEPTARIDLAFICEAAAQSGAR